MRTLPLLFLTIILLAACSGQPDSVSEVSPTNEPVPTDAPTLAPTDEPTPEAEPTETPIPEPTSIPDLNTELVAFYPFDGSADDASGNDNHGVVNGPTLTIDRFGNPDSAYAFDGVDDFIEVPPSQALTIRGPSSFSAWVNFAPQETPTWYTVFEKSDPERDGHSRWGIWLIRDKAEFCVQSMAVPTHYCLDSETSLVEGEWTHVLGVWTGDTIQLYLNGELELETNHGRAAVNATNFPLYVGTDPFNVPQLFTKGAFDDIRIYKRALSAEEALDLYQLDGDEAVVQQIAAVTSEPTEAPPTATAEPPTATPIPPTNTPIPPTPTPAPPTATSIPPTAVPPTEPPVPQAQLLIGFDNAAEASNWFLINDTVMGGVSTSQGQIANGALVFNGNLSLANNGGFTSVRRGYTQNLEGFNGVRVRLRGDGRSYFMRFRDFTDGQEVAHEVQFSTVANTWTVVDLPFEWFVPSFRGIPIDRPDLNLSNLRSVGFMLREKMGLVPARNRLHRGISLDS